MPLIGDRERERIAALLGRHYLGGRLTVDELSERLQIALTARGDREASLALADLPSGWSRWGLQARLSGLQRAVGRAVFVLAVWMLWWAASLVLLIAFVAVVVMHGFSIANVVLFPALWVLCTVGASQVTRRSRR
jgi:DUF1707 SHOCT-like domain